MFFSSEVFAQYSPVRHGHVCLNPECFEAYIFNQDSYCGELSGISQIHSRPRHPR